MDISARPVNPTPGGDVDVWGGKVNTVLDAIWTLLQAAATGQDVADAVAALVGSAPAALDTLKELADALGNDADFAAHLTTQLASKADVAQLSDYASLDGSSRLAIDGTEITAGQVGAIDKPTAQGIALVQALIFGS